MAPLATVMTGGSLSSGTGVSPLAIFFLTIWSVLVPSTIMPSMHPIPVGIYDRPTVPAEKPYCLPKTKVNVLRRRYKMPKRTAMYKDMIRTVGERTRILRGRTMASFSCMLSVISRSSNEL